MKITDKTKQKPDKRETRFGKWYKIANSDGKVGFATLTNESFKEMICFFENEPSFTVDYQTFYSRNYYNVLEEVEAELIFTSKA